MKKAFKFSLFFILLIILAVYFIGFSFFSKHFLPFTTINGRDFSLTSIDKFEDNYNGYYDDYKFELVTRDGSEYINAKDFELKDVIKNKEEIKQNYVLWPFYLFIPKKYDFENEVSFNKNKLYNEIDNLKISKAEKVESKDAEIIFKDGKYEIKKEVYGNIFDKDKLFNLIYKDLISNNKNVLNFEDENLYKNPVILSDDDTLKALVEQKNKIKDIEITFDFEDRKEILKSEEVVSLYKDNGEGTLVPDIDKVKEYVKKLASKYDTFKGSRRFYATNIGDVLVSGGIYGWLTDVDATTEELVKVLENVKSVSLTPKYRLTAQSRSQNDLGNSYVEIDLNRQHMWLYKDGALVVETDIVTGNPTTNNATPTGTNKIWSREKSRFLTGEDYKSFVNYWLPFNWSGCGLHDSSWRNTYGKEIYKTNGSHGCVNTPPELMKTFYDNTFVGMPVIVYDSATQKIS